MVDLDAIKARLDAATSGQWMAEPTMFGYRLGVEPPDNGSGYLALAYDERGDWPAQQIGFVVRQAAYAGRTEEEAKANAFFMAAAHNVDIPALITEVERLREVVGNYRARLTEAEAQIVKLASACEDALSYFEQSWKQVGEHPHAAEAPYVEDLREALGK